MKDQHICRICFLLYPSSSVHHDWPMCPDCESEAISVEVQPLGDFLARHSLADLQQILATPQSHGEWDAETGYLDSYKQAKRKRIGRVIQLERAGAG